MSETQVVVERWIGAPVEKVWQALTDLESAPHVLSGVQSVEVLTPGPFGEGTRWRETRKMLGRTATEEMFVTECEKPSHCVVESEAHGAHYVSEFTLAPQTDEEGGTTVRMSFSATPPGGFAGVMMKVFGGLGTKAVAKSIEKDLADVAAHVERPAPGTEEAEPGPEGPQGPAEPKA
ncbi:SRPBCC family protein [Streptomyces sp. 8N616]|uniref:SRPBCC family protein n=1 Tax=Streptomyces sp. 8N616 TaxID=3457414 RepID=UPI003FD59D33